MNKAVLKTVIIFISILFIVNCTKKTDYPKGETLVANFSSSATLIEQNKTVLFTADESLGNPTEWQWTFQGGNPSSSSEQYPAITYSSVGTYSVSLTVKNAYGTHTINKADYITVVLSCEEKVEQLEVELAEYLSQFSSNTTKTTCNSFKQKMLEVLNTKKDCNSISTLAYQEALIALDDIDCDDL